MRRFPFTCIVLALPLLLAACETALITDTGAILLLPRAEQQGSAGLTPDPRFEVRLDGEAGAAVTPRRIGQAGVATVRRAPGTQVFLAGSPDGTRPVSVDDFLLIEIEDRSRPSGLRQLVAGATGPVRRGVIPVQNIAPQSPIPPEMADLTLYITACARTKVGAVAMDTGVIAEADPVYLIVRYPEGDFPGNSCVGRAPAEPRSLVP